MASRAPRFYSAIDKCRWRPEQISLLGDFTIAFAGKLRRPCGVASTGGVSFQSRLGLYSAP